MLGLALSCCWPCADEIAFAEEPDGAERVSVLLHARRRHLAAVALVRCRPDDEAPDAVLRHQPENPLRDVAVAGHCRLHLADGVHLHLGADYLAMARFMACVSACLNADTSDSCSCSAGKLAPTASSRTHARTHARTPWHRMLFNYAAGF
jgi:hypothetical protein